MAQNDAHLATVKCICKKACDQITFDVRRTDVIGGSVNSFLKQAAVEAIGRDKAWTSGGQNEKRRNDSCHYQQKKHGSRLQTASHGMKMSELKSSTVRRL